MINPFHEANPITQSHPKRIFCYMKYEVVINRESGTGLFKEEEPRNRLKQLFTDHGHEVEILVVPPSELEAALRKSADGSTDVLIVGGGDGTVRTAAEFLQGTHKALGVLPLGTFNLEARSLHVALDPFEAVAQLMDADVIEIESAAIRIDVARQKHIPAMIDGEIVRLDLPCELTILPRALKVLRPRNPAS